MKFHELIAYIKSIICRLKLSEMSGYANELCTDLHTFTEHKYEHWIKPGSKRSVHFTVILCVFVLTVGFLEISSFSTP